MNDLALPRIKTLGTVLLTRTVDSINIRNTIRDVYVYDRIVDLKHTSRRYVIPCLTPHSLALFMAYFTPYV